MSISVGVLIQHTDKKVNRLTDLATNAFYVCACLSVQWRHWHHCHNTLPSWRYT